MHQWSWDSQHSFDLPRNKSRGNLKHLHVSNNSTKPHIRHDEISPFDDTSLFKTPVDHKTGPINNAFFLTATALSLEDALSFHKHVRCHRDKTSVLQMCILPCFTMFYPSTFNVGETKNTSAFLYLFGFPDFSNFSLLIASSRQSSWNLQYVLQDLYAFISTWHNIHNWTSMKFWYVQATWHFICRCFMVLFVTSMSRSFVATNDLPGNRLLPPSTGFI